MFTKGQAPSFQWAHEIGNSTYVDQTFGVATDATGNVFFAGQFNTLTDFDPSPGTYTLAGNGSYDVYLAKFNSAGNLIWARSWGSSALDGGSDVTIDNIGNVYVCGYFNGVADFDPGIGTYSLASSGQKDVFITKLDPLGNFIWARSIGGSLVDDAYSINVDPSGNVICGGTFEGTADFDPGIGTYTMSSNGGKDCYLLKLDPSGNFSWVKTWGGSQVDAVHCFRMDNSGNYCITGSYMDVVDFDPGVGINSVNSSGMYDQDAFILKLDVNGNFTWIKTINGVGTDYGRAITVDASGDIFCTGIYLATRDFDPGAGTYTMTSSGWSDAFVLKLTSNGNFVWAKGFGGTNSEIINSIVINSTGLIYVTGSFYGTADFDPSPATYTVSSFTPSQLDAFLLKLDPNGNFNWVGTVGTSYDDYGNDLAFDLSDNLFMVGSFAGVGDFDLGPGTYTLGVTSSAQAFHIKMNDCYLPFSPTNITPVSNQTICANNTTTLMASSTGTINWYSSPTSTVTLGTGTNYVTPTLTAGSYTYYAEAKTCGPSATRTAITLLVSPCTGISNLTSINTSIKIYPNPSTGIFHLSNPGGEKLEIKILNALGQQVLNKVIYENENLIDISNFSNGVYFIRIKNHSDETNTIKLIKE